MQIQYNWGKAKGNEPTTFIQKGLHNASVALALDDRE